MIVKSTSNKFFVSLCCKLLGEPSDLWYCPCAADARITYIVLINLLMICQHIELRSKHRVRIILTIANWQDCFDSAGWTACSRLSVDSIYSAVSCINIQAFLHGSLQIHSCRESVPSCVASSPRLVTDRMMLIYLLWNVKSLVGYNWCPYRKRNTRGPNASDEWMKLC